MRLGIFIDGVFIPERDGASTRFAKLPRHLTEQGTPVAAFHCYRGWSDLARIAAQPFPTYFFPPSVFYDDLECVARLAKEAGVTMIQMNDAETILRLGCPLGAALGVKVIYEAHYHTSTLAAALGAHPDRVEALRVIEFDVCRRVDHLIVFTDADRQRWTSLSGASADRVSVVPFGVEQVYPSRVPNEREGLVFIGNLFYEPNRRAVERIARDILPAIRSSCPDASASVIGGIPDELKALCVEAGIEVVGEVPDPLPWLERAAVGLAPVSEGSGVRVKILQCLAAGLPVVATSVGAEGLAFAALFEENGTQAVAARCIHILQHPGHYAPLVQDTTGVLRASFQWRDVARVAGRIYSNLVVGPPRTISGTFPLTPQGLPLWLEEVMTKSRFAGANACDLGDYRFGTAKDGVVRTYQ